IRTGAAHRGARTRVIDAGLADARLGRTLAWVADEAARIRADDFAGAGARPASVTFQLRLLFRGQVAPRSHALAQVCPDHDVGGLRPRDDTLCDAVSVGWEPLAKELSRGGHQPVSTAAHETVVAAHPPHSVAWWSRRGHSRRAAANNHSILLCLPELAQPPRM